MNWKAYVQEIGISTEEYNRLEQLLGREPNAIEIEMVGAMWSEHCSYKSSKSFLGTLPTQSKVNSKRVVCSPGENAGAVSIGDGQLLVFKVESHNHPSCIDPEQGAATGVGGILRDIFTMGARPVALMNALFFGDWSSKKTAYLTKGVAKGMGYGNFIGIPNVGGVTFFDEGYNKNILVNAMAVGVSEKLFYSKGEGVGNLLVYAGNLTGTDGVYGARMSSSPLKEQNNNTSIQVADPFIGKSIMESCLEILEAGRVIALQDMGAAGITCSTVEVASKGDLGVEIDLDLVPQRGSKELTTKEILLSESQERMLFIIKPENLLSAQMVFKKWSLYHAVIGKLTSSKLVTVRHKKQKVAELPIKVLTDYVPAQEREQKDLPPVVPVNVVAGKLELLGEAMMKVLSSPNFCSKNWIYQQYDHTVGGNTIQSNASNIGVIRVEVDGKEDKAVAMSLDCSFIYCKDDPYKGAILSVASCWRDLISMGAQPLAITNCLNFGDPRLPRIMRQFALAVDGMREACSELDFPVVSGNVSFYNQTDDIAIPPTPVIGGVGLISSISHWVKNHIQSHGSDLVLIGKTSGHLQKSAYAEYVLGEKNGLLPGIDLEVERKIGEFVLNLDHDVKSCRAVKQGGVIIALFNACIQNGIGAELNIPQDVHPIPFLFGEDQSRYLVETGNAKALLEAAKRENILALYLGKTIEQFEIKVEKTKVNLANLLKLYRDTMSHRFEN